jgi:hypothetical protein
MRCLTDTDQQIDTRRSSELTDLAVVVFILLPKLKHIA